MAYFLGVDGGGTKTVAVISDQAGIIKGIGYAGNSNHQTHRHSAELELRKAIQDAIYAADIKQSQLVYSCFGLSGADTPQDYKIVHKMIRNLGFKHYSIYNDGIIALKAAVSSFTGMTLICGTATNAIGRDTNGNIHQVGGFGYQFGDFGGGHQLSKETFRLVIRSSEGREPETLLTHLVLNELNFKTVNHMYDYYLTHKDNIPTHLTPLLFEAADQGDEAAICLIERQASELVISAEALAARMKLLPEPFSLVLAGSVITKSKNDLMYNALLASFEKSRLKANIIKLQADPVVGACLLAIKASPDKENQIKKNLIQSLSLI